MGANRCMLNITAAIGHVLANPPPLHFRCAPVKVGADGKIRVCRLASVQHSPAADSAAALAIALPILTHKGLSSHLKFVKANSINTLSSIIDLVTALQIAPHLPAVVQSLLESLSNLETTAFARVAMVAEAHGMDAGNLDERRVALSSQTPMHSSLQRCARLVSEESVEAVVPVLTTIIRRGAPSSPLSVAAPRRAGGLALVAVPRQQRDRHGSPCKMQKGRESSAASPESRQHIPHKRALTHFPRQATAVQSLAIVRLTAE
jgi:hypothetical protein